MREEEENKQGMSIKKKICNGMRSKSQHRIRRNLMISVEKNLNPRDEYFLTHA